MSLRYGAPPGCPDVDRYAGHVRSRSTNLSIQPEADALAAADAVNVQVQPAPDAAGWLGRVTIEGPLALDREVRGARCEDVVAALALITVLRLEGADASSLAGSSVAGTTSPTNADPGAATGASAGATAREGAPPAAAAPLSTAAPGQSPPEPGLDPGEAPARQDAEADTAAATPPSAPAPELTPDAPASEPPAAATPTPDPPTAERAPEDADDGRAASIADGDAMADGSGAARAGAPAASEPLPPAVASGGTTTEADSVSADSSESASAASWRWPSVSASTLALRAGYASVPEHAFKAALEGELRLGDGWVSELTLAYARGKDEVDVAKLDLSLLTLDVGLCPLELGADASVWLRACAGLRAGAIHLAIRPTEPGLPEASVWRPWVSLTPSLRVGVPLSEHWTIRVLAELAVQLVRDNFDVGFIPVDATPARRVTVHRPEAISLELGLGVGYSF